MDTQNIHVLTPCRTTYMFNISRLCGCMHVSIALVCIYNGIQNDFDQRNITHMNGEADNSHFARMYVYTHFVFKELNNNTTYAMADAVHYLIIYPDLTLQLSLVMPIVGLFFIGVLEFRNATFKIWAQISSARGQPIIIQKD